MEYVIVLRNAQVSAGINKGESVNNALKKMNNNSMQNLVENQGYLLIVEREPI